MGNSSRIAGFVISPTPQPLAGEGRLFLLFKEREGFLYCVLDFKTYRARLSACGLLEPRVLLRSGTHKTRCSVYNF